MHSKFKIGLAAATLFLSPTLLAQKTWIVDASNGPGTHYVDLPAAVAAAKAGDRILMRAGNYKSATINKGLAILGTAGVVIQAPAFIGPGLRIQNIPATQVFRIRDVTIEDQLIVAGGLLDISNNEGGVHLENVTIRTRNQHPRSPFAKISQSKHVTLNNCSSPTGLTVLASMVMVNGGSYQGTDGYAQWGHGCWNVPSASAFIVDNSQVRLTQLSARGGNGHAGCWNTPVAGSPALRATRSTITVTGSTTLNAGTRSSQAAAVGANGSQLVLDPKVTFNTTPPHTGFTIVTSRRLPVVVASGGKVGDAIQSKLYGAPNDFYFFYESLPHHPVPVVDFGNVWLDPSTLIFLGAGVHDATGEAEFRLPIPNVAGWRGVPILQQVWGGTFVNGFRYSNARVVVLH